MVVGWRQWADAGSVSSALPKYLLQHTNAHKIGQIKPDGFYLFQIPGTHDLVRPIVKFKDGYPQSIEARKNELFYTGDENSGVVFFLGDEPHLDVERYTDAMLYAARELGVNRIIGLGGVYGELPYDKERAISASYSLPSLRQELEDYGLNFTDYHGGASIGSFLCRRAADENLEYVGMYAFVPTYDFSNISEIGKSIRIENDFRAWLGIARRIKHMFKLDWDLHEMETKSDKLTEMLDSKVDELEVLAPDLGVREYMDSLAEDFTEVTFDPLSDVWTDEIRRLLDNDEG
jgi:proteasome assembly chaperone (PAC2) family protein